MKISRIKVEVEREDGIISSVEFDEMTLEFKDLGEFLKNLDNGIKKTFDTLGGEKSNE